MPCFNYATQGKEQQNKWKIETDFPTVGSDWGRGVERGCWSSTAGGPLLGIVGTQLKASFCHKSDGVSLKAEMIPERPHFDGKHVSKVAMANFDWNVSSGER